MSSGAGGAGTGDGSSDGDAAAANNGVAAAVAAALGHNTSGVSSSTANGVTAVGDTTTGAPGTGPPGNTSSLGFNVSPSNNAQNAHGFAPGIGGGGAANTAAATLGLGHQGVLHGLGNAAPSTHGQVSVSNLGSGPGAAGNSSAHNAVNSLMQALQQKNPVQAQQIATQNNLSPQLVSELNALLNAQQKQGQPGTPIGGGPGNSMGAPTGTAAAQKGQPNGQQSLNPAVIAQLNSLLGSQGAAPSMGATLGGTTQGATTAQAPATTQGPPAMFGQSVSPAIAQQIALSLAQNQASPFGQSHAGQQALANANWRSRT